MLKKPNTIFILIVLLFTGAISAQSFNYVETAGGTGKDYGSAIAVDNNGNIFVGGEFSATGTFGTLTAESNGNVDYYIAKYDSNHVAQWVKTGGGTITDRVYGVALDNEGNIYVAGHFFGTAQIDTASLTSAGNLDMFVMKLNPDGEAEWVRQATSASQVSPRDIAVDADGNVVVAGYFGSSSVSDVTIGDITLTSNGNRDCMVVKFDNNGNALWAKNIGGTNSGEESNDVAVDTDGNIYLTGMFSIEANFGGTTYQSKGADDLFIVKYAPNGNQLMVITAGGLKDEEPNSIALDNSGNIYVAGAMDSAATFGSYEVVGNGNDDAFIAKYDPSGNAMWAVGFGGTETDYLSGIAVDRLGNVYGTGQFKGTATFGSNQFTSAGNYDAFFVKLDTDGNLIWVNTAGGSGLDRGFACATDYGTNLYVSGSFRESANFGGSSLTSQGSDEIFIARFGEYTVPVELVSFSADVNNSVVSLSWKTATELNNSGFEIEKSYDNSDFEKVGFVKGNGTTANFSSYSFADNSTLYGKIYYRLKQIDYNGDYEYSNTIEVLIGSLTQYELGDNYPNPFNPSTNIQFTLPVDAKITLNIYNTLGQKVATALDNNFTAGVQSFNFDASELSSGMYIYQITAAGIDGSKFVTSKKMLLMK